MKTEQELAVNVTEIIIENVISWEILNRPVGFAPRAFRRRIV